MLLGKQRSSIEIKTVHSYSPSCDMTSERLILQLLTGILALPSALLGLIQLLFAILFFGNFHFSTSWHCIVLATTIVVPFLTLGCYYAYLRRQTWARFAWSITSSCLVFVTLLLWSSPKSNGLIH